MLTTAFPIYYIWKLVCQFSSQVFPFSSSRNTIFHPGRLSIALHIMIEELLQSDAQILAVSTLYQVMFLLVILQHPDFLAQSALSHENFDVLIASHSCIVVIVHDEQLWSYLVCLEER